MLLPYLNGRSIFAVSPRTNCPDIVFTEPVPSASAYFASAHTETIARMALNSSYM